MKTYRIYAVVGDYYHRADWLEQALKATVNVLQERAGAAEAEQGSAAYELRMVPYDKLRQAMEEQRPDVLVISKEERLLPEGPEPGSWLDREEQLMLEQYVASGGALMAWHSGLAYQTDGIYRRMLRGYFLHHPEQRIVSYEHVPGSLELGNGAAFAFKDEHYFVHCEEAETQVFLRSKSEDGESIAGWTHEYGKGRVLCLTPAHTLEGLTNRALLELLADCLRTLVHAA